MVLDVRDGGLMVHAIALSNWHRAHGHCSRCGAATEVTVAGTSADVRSTGLSTSRTDPR